MFSNINVYFSKHSNVLIRAFPYFVLLVVVIATSFILKASQQTQKGIMHASAAGVYPPTGTGVSHLEYTFPDGNMYVYDIDNNFQLVYSRTLPTSYGVRGTVASPTDGMLYISYGQDGGSNSAGSLLKYDLINNSIVWQKTYTFGIDSPA